MKSRRYTIHLIPENVDHQKIFSISRWWIRTTIFLLIIFIAVIIGGLWYYIPQVAEFNKKEKQFNKMLSERTQVLDLISDLNRLGQMEDVIRTSLGVLDRNADQKSPNEEKTFTISYVENIPSQAPVDGFLTQRMLDSSHVWTEKSLRYRYCRERRRACVSCCQWSCYLFRMDI